MNYNSQVQLISTGICRGEDTVSTEQLATQYWFKYKTDGTPDGEKRQTPADEIIQRLGVESRPYASSRQTHVYMFNAALDQAIQQAETQGHSVRGNINMLCTGSTTPQARIPDFLEQVCEYARLPKNAPRAFISHACTTFGTGVNAINCYAEDHPDFEGYAIASAAEIIRPLWKPDNFDLMMFGCMAGVALFKITRAPNLPLEQRGIIGSTRDYTKDTQRDIVWGEDGCLYMNGRAVMEQAPVSLIKTCERSLAEARLTARDITMFILHPGSRHVHRTSGRKVARLYGEGFNPETQLPHCLRDSGNNGGVTTLNTLHRKITEGAIGPTDKIYVGAIGMGYYGAGFIINGLHK